MKYEDKDVLLPFRSIKDHIYEFLFNKINNGNLKPGERININSICDVLQVSPTPVKEALSQLANERILIKLPRRAYVIRELCLEEIKELYAIFGSLEALAASLAISNLEEKYIEEMRRLVEKMDECIERKNYRLYDKFQFEFHDVYVTLSGNKELQMLIESLRKFFIKRNYLRVDDNVLLETLRISNREHKKIVELFEKRDKKGLEEFLKEVHWTVHTTTLL